MTNSYPDDMFDEAFRREKENEEEQTTENNYWRKRLRDLEEGKLDENSADN